MRIAAAGARTAIGVSLLETAMSLRAGIQRIRRAPFVDSHGESFLVAPVLELARSLEGTPRGIALARPALADVVGNAKRDWKELRVGLVLAVERRWPVECEQPRLASWLEELEAAWQDFPAAVVAHLADLGIVLRRDRITRLDGDASAGVLGLSAAKEWLEADEVDACLVGGVSASCEAPWLMLLDEYDLTHAARRDGGMIVGEGAAFVLLEKDGTGPRIAGWARHEDPSQPVLRASTATRALREALRGTWSEGGREVDLLLDTNGRTDRTRVWSLAQTRTLGARRITCRKREPAAYFGDVGVATLPLYLGLAKQLALRESVIAIAHGPSAAASAVVLEEGGTH